MLVLTESLFADSDFTTISLMAKCVRFLGGLDADLFLLNENPFQKFRFFHLHLNLQAWL